MKINDQVLLSVVVSLAFIIVISGSIIVTYQGIQQIQHQEDLAADVVRGGYELTSLTNDYLINGGSRARTQWEGRYASLGVVISQLEGNTPDEQQRIGAIRDYYATIGALFRDMPTPEAGTGLFSPATQQVLWSRYEVQTQGLISGAWRLRHAYDDEASNVRTWNNILVLALMISIVVIITINYLLISRRLINSIGEVNRGIAAFSAGNLTYQIPCDEDDEIGGVARGLNAMAGQLRNVTASRDELDREIGERRLVEEALRQSEQKFRLVVENAPDAIFIQVDGRFAYVNPAACRLFGAEMPGDLAGRPVPDLIHPEDRAMVRERIRVLNEERVPVSRVSETILTLSGTELPVEVSAVPVVYTGSDGALVFMVDITSRVEAERQRLALIRELEQKNAELERFTYTVSHDLKSPLITIRGFLGLLRDDALKGDTGQIEHDIRRITSATDKMQALLSDLLTLSRIGRVINPPERVNLGMIAEEARDLLAGAIQENGVLVTIAPGLPDVIVDHQRIREVLTNLLENAVKFRGEQPDPRVEIGHMDHDGEMVFYVRDNGIGIDPAYLDRVFKLFEKLDQKSEGTGIGLSIVQRIIAVHGGRIWAESAGKGQGTTFFFTLPLAGGPEKERGAG